MSPRRTNRREDRSLKIKIFRVFLLGSRNGERIYLGRRFYLHGFPLKSFKISLLETTPTLQLKHWRTDPVHVTYELTFLTRETLLIPHPCPMSFILNGLLLILKFSQLFFCSLTIEG